MRLFRSHGKYLTFRGSEKSPDVKDKKRFNKNDCELLSKLIYWFVFNKHTSIKHNFNVVNEKFEEYILNCYKHSPKNINSGYSTYIEIFGYEIIPYLIVFEIETDILLKKENKNNLKETELFKKLIEYKNEFPDYLLEKLNNKPTILNKIINIIK